MIKVNGISWEKMVRNIDKTEKIELLDTKKKGTFKGDLLNVVGTLVEMTLVTEEIFESGTTFK